WEWSPSRSLLASLRTHQRLAGSHRPWQVLLRKFAFLRHRFWSVVTASDIPLGTRIGGGLLLPHPTGVVMHGDVAMGPNCRVLRARNAPVWLISHARTRDELQALFGDDARILYVEDTRLHRFMWRLGRLLPAGVAYLTTGYVIRLSSQLAQRRLVRRLIAE